MRAVVKMCTDVSFYKLIYMYIKSDFAMPFLHLQDIFLLCCASGIRAVLAAGFFLYIPAQNNIAKNILKILRF